MVPEGVCYDLDLLGHGHLRSVEKCRKLGVLRGAREQRQIVEPHLQAVMLHCQLEHRLVISS